MKGVFFGDYHSWDDFSLILSKPTISAPDIKTETIDIPGADGQLDLTEYFGEPKYKNRKLSFDFSTIVPRAEFTDLFSEIQNALHGKKMRVILDEDDEFYYYGRISVADYKAEKSVGKITIDVDADPYKYRVIPTIVQTEVSGERTVAYQNLRKSVVPTFTTTANMNITFGEATYATTAGTFILPDVQFTTGTNIIQYAGTGTVTVEYQEGGL